MGKDLSSSPDLKAIQARVDAAPEGPWFLSDCEGTLQIWREAVLRNVTRDGTGQITGYRDPARWRPGDLISEWDLDTWDPGQDDDDDRIRAIAEFIAAARTDVPTLLAKLAELEGERDDLTGQVAGRDATIQRVRDRHSEFKIYTECGHQHAEGEPDLVEVEDVGLVCQDGYMYSVCRECCTENGEQTEVCATDHLRHYSNGPLCPTRKDIDGDPADGGAE